MYRETVGEKMSEKILYIAESMNKPSGGTYVPKMPNQSELDLIFDTSFVDIQPYLFKVRLNKLHNVAKMGHLFLSYQTLYKGTVCRH